MTRCLLADPKGTARAEPGQNLQYTHPSAEQFQIDSSGVQKDMSHRRSIHQAIHRSRYRVSLSSDFRSYSSLCTFRILQQTWWQHILRAVSTTCHWRNFLCRGHWHASSRLKEHELLRVGTGTSRYRKAGRLALLGALTATGSLPVAGSESRMQRCPGGRGREPPPPASKHAASKYKPEQDGPSVKVTPGVRVSLRPGPLAPRLGGRRRVRWTRVRSWQPEVRSLRSAGLLRIQARAQAHWAHAIVTVTGA